MQGSSYTVATGILYNTCEVCGCVGWLVGDGVGGAFLIDPKWRSTELPPWGLEERSLADLRPQTGAGGGGTAVWRKWL